MLVARPGLVEGMLTFEAFPDATIPKALAFSGESFSEPSLPSKTVTRLGCWTIRVWGRFWATIVWWPVEMLLYASRYGQQKNTLIQRLKWPQTKIHNKQLKQNNDYVCTPYARTWKTLLENGVRFRNSEHFYGGCLRLPFEKIHRFQKKHYYLQREGMYKWPYLPVAGPDTTTNVSGGCWFRICPVKDGEDMRLTSMMSLEAVPLAKSFDKSKEVPNIRKIAGYVVGAQNMFLSLLLQQQ